MSIQIIKPIPYVSESNIEKFWTFVDKTSHPGKCWIWTSVRDTGGYGRFRIFRAPGIIPVRLAHRVSYFLVTGKDSKLPLLHHCDTPQCVNPEHLYEGTELDNVGDAIRRGRFWQKSVNCGAFGEENTSAKINVDTVRSIRKMKADGIASAFISEKYGISISNVNIIARRSGWKHVH